VYSQWKDGEFQSLQASAVSLQRVTGTANLVNMTLNMRYKNDTRNALDCDQFNCFLRIVFSHIGLPIEFGQTGNSAIRSTDPENPILEPNTE